MEEPARHLFFHGIIVLLTGLLIGIPYGKAIVRTANERLIEGWRVAHAALPMGAILMLVISLSFSSLNVTINLQWGIAILFILSGYAFVWALTLGPILGYRGLSSHGPLTARIVHVGMLIGAMTSFLGTLVLLYAAWENL
ncbi:MAG: hypothetical protein ACPGYT_06550 [Nitrospirales bacterium]